MATHIQSPPEWGWDRVKATVSGVGAAKPEEYWPDRQAAVAGRRAAVPEVRRIGLADLRIALSKGIADFAANRSDVVFLCLIYPVVGLVLGRLMFGYQMLPLLFPLASGFALVGPLAAIGLNEMSRQRERRGDVTWADAFCFLRSPSIGAITQLGGLLLAIFLIWMVAANVIYVLTFGPEPPVRIGAFIRDVLTTPAGWSLIVVGVGVGFLFAVLVLSLSVVSFPLLLDRPASFDTALRTSFRAVRMNVGPMAAWGLIVALALLIGSIPLFLGLIVVFPVLGHATWHLYRRVVVPS
ncbi:MAG TPA: DUF2189 domain-containing protein [Stellaceae bacterium]